MIANDDLGNLGRLGNQMFQYASLLGIAKKHGYEYCIPPVEVFGVKDPKVKKSDVNIFDCFNLLNEPKLITNYPKVMESTFALDKNLWENCPDNISLHGYFQTEKYFEHIKDDIRKAFTFVDEVSKPTKQYFDEHFTNTEVISLHIRRTDYLTFEQHPVQELDYYVKGLSELPDDLPVIIFSDDIEWCSKQSLFQSDRFNLSEGNDTSVDMFLQTLCFELI